MEIESDVKGVCRRKRLWEKDIVEERKSGRDSERKTQNGIKRNWKE